METTSVPGRSIHPLAWAAGIAVIVFSAVGIAASLGWIPNSLGGAGETPALAAAPSTAAPAAPARHFAPVAKNAAPVQHAAAASNARCAECGVIESVNEVDTKGTGTGLGAVGGAVVGGLLGSQVGGGRGKDVMAVVGAVGGGFAGNEVEKRVKTTKSYSVTVRLDDGTSRVISEATAPSWQAGDKVRIVNGVIRSNA